MGKTYNMRPTNKVFGVWLPNLLFAGMVLYGLAEIALHGFERFYVLLVVVPFVFLLSALRGLHQPHRIDFAEDEVTFTAFGRKHTYRLSDLTFLRVRRFAYVKQALVRIGPQTLIGGRYWIDARFMDYDELVDRFERLEREVRQRPTLTLPKAKRRARS